MTSPYAEALTALRAEGPVSRDDVRRWVESGDLLAWSVVYDLAARGGDRIQPEIAMDEHTSFMRSYLLRCIEENPPAGDHLHGGFEAAWELAATIKHWRRSGGNLANLIRGVARDLEKLYRRAEPATQNRILCGVLEHAFEDPAVRPYFANWERDAELRDAYKLALEWGNAHE